MNGFSGERILTVSQFNALVKTVLENEPLLRGVTLTGELSGVKKYPSGHIYFTLKDERGAISCVMFASAAATLRFLPTDGMQVKIKGGATVYERDGRYQFIVRSMESDGAGGLYAAYEKLKNKLEKQGLFDEGHKKPIPSFPKRIGVITSGAGAAFHDILNVTARRFPGVDILLYPSAVQGAEAPARLAAGIRYFDRAENVDVIIIGRGGGSMEDLWAFNDEGLARAIYLCRIPVISAVGHETDFTICDFVSDKRAPTPSAAAELAVPDRATLLFAVSGLERRMKSVVEERLEHLSVRLSNLEKSRALTDRATAINAKSEKLDQDKSRFFSAANRILERKESLLRQQAGAMAGLNPMGVLARGYTAVFDDNGALVKSARELSGKDCLTLRFYDGEGLVKVLSNSEKEEE